MSSVPHTSANGLWGGSLRAGGDVRAPWSRRLLGLSLVLSIQGCSGTDPGPVQLFRAEPGEVEAATGFDLVVLGRGFGLNGVRVDLSGDSRAGDTDTLSVTLLGPEGETTVLAPDAVAVETPSRLRLTVRLEVPLPLGAYGARLLRRGELVAEAADLFVVVPSRTGSGAGGADAGDVGG